MGGTHPIHFLILLSYFFGQLFSQVYKFARCTCQSSAFFLLLLAISFLYSLGPGKQDVNNASEISQNKSHIPYKHEQVKKKIISMVESSFAVPLQKATIPNSCLTRNNGQINTE